MRTVRRRTRVTTMRVLTAMYLLAVISAGCGTPSGAGAEASTREHGSAADPVFTATADPRRPYPAARVIGRLQLREGCLMIGNNVAFWPAGTSWDVTKRRVVFGGDFQGAPPVDVGAIFDGGGGVWSPGDNLSGVLSDAEAAAVRNCLERTGARGAVFAWPST